MGLLSYLLAFTTQPAESNLHLFRYTGGRGSRFCTIEGIFTMCCITFLVLYMVTLRDFLLYMGGVPPPVFDAQSRCLYIMAANHNKTVLQSHLLEIRMWKSRISNLLRFESLCLASPVEYPIEEIPQLFYISSKETLGRRSPSIRRGFLWHGNRFLIRTHRSRQEITESVWRFTKWNQVHPASWIVAYLVTSTADSNVDITKMRCWGKSGHFPGFIGHSSSSTTRNLPHTVGRLAPHLVLRTTILRTLSSDEKTACRASSVGERVVGGVVLQPSWYTLRLCLVERSRSSDVAGGRSMISLAGPFPKEWKISVLVSPLGRENPG